jgi:hypothetical protein
VPTGKTAVTAAAAAAGAPAGLKLPDSLNTPAAAGSLGRGAA